MRKQKQTWLRTNEIEDLINSLEHCAELSASLQEKPLNWKWLIIALHNSLQGACVCALKGWDTSGTVVLTKKSARKMWHWLNVDSRQNPAPPMPEEFLAYLFDLYESVQDSNFPEPHRLPLDSSRDKDVKRLNELRNDFIHFKPGGYSLELEGMPRIVGNCCDVIEHLAVKHPTFWHHLNDNLRQRIETALAKIRERIEAL